MFQENNKDSDQWVAYVGPFGFPAGGAAARRVLGNAQSLVDAGFGVVVASGQVAGDPKSFGFREGIEVVSLGERTAEHWPNALRRIRYAAMGNNTRDWLEAQESLPAAVILYGGYSPYLLRLIPWCRDRNVPLIFDAVEWYEANGMFGWLFSPYQWNIELAMRWLIKRTDGVIAISSYLANYYDAAGLPVVNIPPTLSIDEFPDSMPLREDDRLHICYAGLPGSNKDLIDIVIKAALSVDKDGRRLVLHIAGPNKQELLGLPSLSGHSRKMPKCINSYGMLAQGDAMSLVQRCDFSVLLRRDHRVTKAGFSTKFVESLATGTPVIGNLTGDLADYLVDRKTGIVCIDWSLTELQHAFQRALAMSGAELADMRSECKKMALANFDTKIYAKALGDFVKRVSQ